MDCYWGYRIAYLEETDSTNAECRRWVERGVDGHKLLLWTDFQSAGRGQQGNKWESQQGKNLTFTLCVQPSFLLSREQFLLSEVVSLSLCGMLNELKEGFCVKWPNDIYFGGRKVAGILIEHCLKSSVISQSYIGVGLNVNQEDFVSDAPNPVSLYTVLGGMQDRRKLLEHFIRMFSYYYKLLENGKADEIQNQYYGNLFRKDGFYPYQDAKGSFRARMVSVLGDGTLVLEDEKGCERLYTFKEVKYIFPDRICD